MQNSIERAFYSSTDQGLSEESLCFVYPLTLDQNHFLLSGRDDESGRIRSTLVICGGDVDAAAVQLGMSRATLYRRFKKYNIKPQRIKQI